MLRDGPIDGYRKMPIYIHMLNTIYPNSYIWMHKLAENEFMYFFIALPPTISGCGFFRLVIVVHEARLSGPYKEIFSWTSTLDGAGTKPLIVLMICC